MKLILVNIFDMNNKELYEKYIKTTTTTTTTIFSYTKKIGQYLKILKVLDQTYLSISVVVIFKFVY